MVAVLTVEGSFILYKRKAAAPVYAGSAAIVFISSSTPLLIRSITSQY